MAFARNHLSSSHRIYITLKERIRAVEIAPRSSLEEQRIAEELGVSRTPVREGLVRLAAEGLVDLIPNRGAFVAPIRTEAVRAAQFIRESLEVALALEAANRIDAIGELRLRQAIEEQKLAELEGQYEVFYRSDERMHRTITEIAERPLVWSHIEEAKIQMDRVRRLNLMEVSSFAKLIDQHERIVGAICKNDRARITRTMKDHLRSVLPDLEALKVRHPEHFAADEEWQDDVHDGAKGGLSGVRRRV